MKQYGLFRYKYHTEYAIYLETIGEIDNANNQKDLAKIFEKSKKNSEEMNFYRTTSVLFAKLDNVNQVSDSKENLKENSMLDVEKHLKVIQDILER